ncbi:uncharacterized protein LOC116187570 [Punica granatum]|uniref:Uncharacterized protein n=2 Tax=Punica granatum TaxID=22663 RepID=A0A218XP97_PUNGR|nr:uncharacterized protein LOC116187570 [Punica granatum]OWM86754.1 hypothetical protein CDL15_Pgr015790 [Punica granatum]PKI43106.1 hypothetical protein CRG98_036485 [Punica granatum]
MDVAVLHPRDCLSTFPNSNLGRANPTRVRQGRRRRSPSKSQSTSPPPRPSKTLVMGEVKLLRRGEELKGTAPKSSPADEPAKPDRIQAEPNRRVVAPARNRLAGPAQERVARLHRAPAELARADAPAQKAVAIQSSESAVGLASFYAGFAFITSPPPSSLPVPAFCSKKTAPLDAVDATSDLRKLLRLD